MSDLIIALSLIAAIISASLVVFYAWHYFMKKPVSAFGPTWAWSALFIINVLVLLKTLR